VCDPSANFTLRPESERPSSRSEFSRKYSSEVGLAVPLARVHMEQLSASGLLFADLIDRRTDADALLRAANSGIRFLR
jgi:hypothetical protein